MLLYAVTAEGEDLPEKVEQAIAGGVTLVQLREKRRKGEDLKEMAEKVKAVCDAHGVLLIINDDVELALRIDAAGVHLGQGDLTAYEARKLLGENKIIGVTARTAALARQAERNGADYIGSGAVFATQTKSDAVLLAHDTLREICNSVSIPVVAIGGIGVENITELKGTHIAGVAVVSSLFGAQDVCGTAKKLKTLAKEAVEE